MQLFSLVASCIRTILAEERVIFTAAVLKVLNPGEKFDEFDPLTWFLRDSHSMCYGMRIVHAQLILFFWIFYCSMWGVHGQICHSKFLQEIHSSFIQQHEKEMSFWWKKRIYCPYENLPSIKSLQHFLSSRLHLWFKTWNPTNAELSIKMSQNENHLFSLCKHAHISQCVSIRDIRWHDIGHE